MEFFHHDKTILLSELLTICMIVVVSSLGPVYTPPDVERLTDRFSRLPVNEGYNAFFGGANVRFTNNGSSADLILDKSSGAGLVSRDKYYYGFFNAALKLPANFTSGVVVAFYLSNQNIFPKKHDELDFELLGYEKRRRSWVLQTNVYGNGSVSTGREEKFYLWFDPTQDFHDYTILWNNHHIVDVDVSDPTKVVHFKDLTWLRQYFWGDQATLQKSLPNTIVDNVPIREVVHNTAISSVYPSKPMSIFATIWDGSEWATHGGKYAVNYTYAPFVTSLRGVELEGCVSQKNDTSCANKRSTSSLDPVDGEEFVKLSQQQMTGLEWARRKHMFYSYCQDTMRYKVLPPECTAN